MKNIETNTKIIAETKINGLTSKISLDLFHPFENVQRIKKDKYVFSNVEIYI